MDIFLDSPKDFEHVCAISRTLETLGLNRCFVFDPNRLIRERYGKSRRRTLNKVSAGAFFRVEFRRVEKPREFLVAHPGRRVATVPDQSATRLPEFRFREDDLVLFGSEGRGLGREALGLCDECVTVPQCGVTQSLNLSVAVGIVLYESLRWG